MIKWKKKFNTIRAVIVTCSTLFIINSYDIVTGLLGMNNKSVVTEACAAEIMEMQTQRTYLEMQNAAGLYADLRENVYSYECVVMERRTSPITSSVESNQVVISSISMRNSYGECISTDEITVDVEPLLELFRDKAMSPEWDTKDKIDTLQVLWEFLVEQQGIPTENAAGILGNIYVEGCFAEQQGTGLYITNIEQARILLGSGKAGYGCVQWTYYERQDNLLNYYELAYELFPDDWDAVRITAECCMLLEECKAYNVFEDIYTATTLEDAVGRVAIKYESYGGCESQWSKSNGLYHLVDNSGSGAERLHYANSIYNYFVE